MSEPNGNGKSRLNRIEEILERHSAALLRIDEMMERQAECSNQVQKRERFEAEDKRLLTAQILMNGAMQKMAEGMTSLELKMEETTGKLNALIDTVDGIIRKKE